MKLKWSSFLLSTDHRDTIWQNRRVLKEILLFQVEMPKKSFAKRVQQSGTCEQQNAKGVKPIGPYVSMHCTFSLGECCTCKFNPAFLHGLSAWASTIQWDINTNETT